jgi:hypothetical protein
VLDLKRKANGAIETDHSAESFGSREDAINGYGKFFQSAVDHTLVTPIGLLLSEGWTPAVCLRVSFMEIKHPVLHCRFWHGGDIDETKSAAIVK